MGDDRLGHIVSMYVLCHFSHIAVGWWYLHACDRISLSSSCFKCKWNVLVTNIAQTEKSKGKKPNQEQCKQGPLLNQRQGQVQWRIEHPLLTGQTCGVVFLSWSGKGEKSYDNLVIYNGLLISMKTSVSNQHGVICKRLTLITLNVYMTYIFMLRNIWLIDWFK